MKKAKTIKKELQIEINGNPIETFNKIDEDFLKNEFGIFKQSDNCFTGGIPLSSCEYEGEGLPPEKDRNAHNLEFDLNFNVRLSHDGKGNIEFLIAKKGSGRHYRFPIKKGLNALQAEIVMSDFEQRMIYSYIPQTLFQFFWACYRKPDNDAKLRKKCFDLIISNFEAHFRNILNRKGEKIIDVDEKDGYKITTYEVNDKGRNKGTKKPRQLSKREIENRGNRKLKIIEAINEAIDSQNKSELADIIGISRPTLNNWLKSIGVRNKEDFYELIRFAEREL